MFLFSNFVNVPKMASLKTSVTYSRKISEQYFNYRYDGETFHNDNGLRPNNF